MVCQLLAMTTPSGLPERTRLHGLKLDPAQTGGRHTLRCDPRTCPISHPTLAKSPPSAHRRTNAELRSACSTQPNALSCPEDVGQQPRHAPRRRRAAWPPATHPAARCGPVGRGLAQRLGAQPRTCRRRARLRHQRRAGGSAQQIQAAGERHRAFSRRTCAQPRTSRARSRSAFRRASRTRCPGSGCRRGSRPCRPGA